MLKKFITTQGSKDGYEDDPWIFMSSVSSVLIGVDLPPLDAIIILDGDYQLAKDEQARSRNSRPTII